MAEIGTVKGIVALSAMDAITWVVGRIGHLRTEEFGAILRRIEQGLAEAEAEAKELKQAAEATVEETERAWERVYAYEEARENLLEARSLFADILTKLNRARAGLANVGEGVIAKRVCRGQQEPRR